MQNVPKMKESSQDEKGSVMPMDIIFAETRMWPTRSNASAKSKKKAYVITPSSYASAKPLRRELSL